MCVCGSIANGHWLHTHAHTKYVNQITHTHTHTDITQALHICALACRLTLQAHKYLCQHIVLSPPHRSPLPTLACALVHPLHLPCYLAVQLMLIEMKLPAAIAKDTYLQTHSHSPTHTHTHTQLHTIVAHTQPMKSIFKLSAPS